MGNSGQKYIIVKDRVEIYKDFALNLLYTINHYYIDDGFSMFFYKFIHALTNYKYRSCTQCYQSGKPNSRWSVPMKPVLR